MTTAHVDTSDISSINRKAGKEPAAVRPETFRLLEQSLALSKQMDGAFDVTLGAIKSLWGFDTENPSIPPDRAIRRLVRFTGSSQIVLGKGTAFLRSPDTRIDLGGLGEGYLIDRGVRMLRDAGITAGIVEATGDLVAFGRNPKRGMWRIGVKHPRDPEGGLIGVIETDEASVATSGDYERYFVTDGKRYCHILDPKTGYPADNGCISVTVLAPNALVADAFATGVFVMRPEMALALIERTPGLEGIIMTEENGQIRQMVSRGLQSKYKLL
jgi:thiamine biosynthesis lipoprotein